MKAVNKNTLREVKKTKSKFMSIFTICAIGVGFFSGVRATGNDMIISADNYYDSHELFDLRVVSTFGLTDNDAEAVRKEENVDHVYTSKYTDLGMYIDGNEYLTRVYSWNNNEVNIIDLLDGRFPEKDNECILNINKLRSELNIGETVKLEDLTGAEEFPLKYKEYTIAGFYETPMYISMTQRGSTTIGDGAIDAFMYVTEDNFTQDVYTELYVKSDQLKEMSSYSGDYEKIRDEISDKLEELGIKQSEIRYDEVVGSALREIEDGEEELAKAKEDGRKELDDARDTLIDAKRQISDGEKELADAKATIEDGKIQIADAEKQLADAKKEISDGRLELIENKQKLDDAEKTLSESKRQIDEGRQQLSQAKSQLDASKKQLDDAQKEIDANKEAIEAGKQQLSEAKNTLAEKKAEYEAGYEQYQYGLEQYNQGYDQLVQGEEQLAAAELIYGSDAPEIIQQKEQLEQVRAQLEQTKTVLDETAVQLEQAKALLDAGEKEIADNEQILADGEQQIEAAQQQLDEGLKQYNEGFAEYEKNYVEFTEGQAQYLEGYSEYVSGLEQYNDGLNKIQEAERQYNEGIAELADKKQELEDGEREYEEGLADLEQAKLDYEQGLKDYEDGEKEFEKEIADAERELEEAREKIADAGNAKWYVFTRDDNVGYSEYESNSHRIDKIAMIFPIFFLLVAALVCLTTMSRMVEEQRTQIGTLKALGYTNAAVMKHYMLYAISAAAVGSVLGAIVGMYIFPWVIIFAYSMMYNIRNIYFQLSMGNMLLSAGSMVAAIAVTVFFSCKKVLSENPAELMRPKAPKSGKRVLLERISFIWNKMSFFAKVSARNLFRYKRRMFMTIIGIAGCTALSLTGFGLKDSISDVVNLQYNEIYNYSGYLAYDNEIASGEVQEIINSLMDYNSGTEYTKAVIKQYSLQNGSDSAQCYVTAVEDSEIFGEMVDLHDRKTKEKVSLNDGAVITEKLAKLLKVKTGDAIQINISDGVSKTVKIGGITEHYASHYLYLTEEQYKEVFNYSPEYNIIYFTNGITDNEEQRDEFSEKMMGTEGVLSVMLNSGIAENFKETVKILDLVIFVLIVSAGALAFVVLYNLTNVNITERIREIATLKVLGFYDREVSNYVFRENILLSVMGAVVGLLLGTALCLFVIETAELDEIMFGRYIHPLSYIYSFIITVIFSLIVNFIMTGILKKISMVESLKSIE